MEEIKISLNKVTDQIIFRRGGSVFTVNDAKTILRDHQDLFSYVLEALIVYEDIREHGFRPILVEESNIKAIAKVERS